MNCEQVEELLSAYLDNALAPEERQRVSFHLQECAECSSILADFRRFDAILSSMPRVSPDPALREKIFSSPEYLELTGTDDSSNNTSPNWDVPGALTRYPRRDTPGRPQLIAIPGGRSTSPTASIQPPHHLPTRRQGSIGRMLLIAAIAAAILLTLGFGSLIGLNLWQQQNHTANNGAITPPSGPQQSGPLSAGMRFVFLRDGTLFSVLSDGSSAAERLTPKGVTVASNWVVSAPLAGRSAGDMLAYIDLQKALVHTIRSDGQQDTAIQQPLLKTGELPETIWDTETGLTILNSLAWSKDGSMLAFVGNPDGTGLTHLYIYSTQTGSVQMVQPPTSGSVSHPVWSPDGVRLAFELTHLGVESILDYNTSNHGLLNIADVKNSTDTVLAMDWAPDANFPAITWSVGTIGHVHSIWMRHVGASSTVDARVLAIGDYVQAIYSRTGDGGIGSWLMVPSVAGRVGDVWRVDLDSGIRALTNGKQVNFAWWSPDGTQVDYLDSISAGMGTLHVVNLATDIDSLIAKNVADEPAPAWSQDSQELVYSTGNSSVVVHTHASKNILSLKLQGPASAFLWSATSPNELIVALDDNAQGIYVVDTQRNTFVQVDKQGISSPILWTEIP